MKLRWFTPFMAAFIIFLFVPMLVSSCGFFDTNVEPANTEVVVSESEKPAEWQLSPEGDKIAYKSLAENTATTILFFPTTQRKEQLGSCFPFAWIDNIILHCKTDSNNAFLLAADDLVTIPLQVVNLQQVDLKNLLQEGETIYRYQAYDKYFLVLDMNYKNAQAQNYFIINENPTKPLDDILQGYKYITIPTHKAGVSEEKIYSPNKAYYYNLNYTGLPSLVIYSATDDKKLVELAITTSAETIEMGGWAADSSGVYFRVRGGGIGLHDNLLPKAIRKLKVSQ